MYIISIFPVIMNNNNEYIIVIIIDKYDLSMQLQPSHKEKKFKLKYYKPGRTQILANNVGNKHSSCLATMPVYIVLNRNMVINMVIKQSHLFSSF